MHAHTPHSTLNVKRSPRKQHTTHGTSISSPWITSAHQLVCILDCCEVRQNVRFGVAYYCVRRCARQSGNGCQEGWAQRGAVLPATSRATGTGIMLVGPMPQPMSWFVANPPPPNSRCCSHSSSSSSSSGGAYTPPSSSRPSSDSYLWRWDGAGARNLGQPRRHQNAARRIVGGGRFGCCSGPAPSLRELDAPAAPPPAGTQRDAPLAAGALASDVS